MRKPEEWLNKVGEAVMMSAFAGSNPPGIEVEKVISAIQQDARSDDAGLVEIGRLAVETEFKSDDKHTVIEYYKTVTKFNEAVQAEIKRQAALQSARKEGGE